jgi:hypothetical protein
MPTSIDFSEFELHLRQAVSSTFTQLRQRGEQIYAFNLFTAALWEYMYPSYSSEESLLRSAQEFQTSATELENQVEWMRTARWNPADWENADPSNRHFQAVNDWLTANDITGWVTDDGENEKEFDKKNDFLDKICRGVLRQLDAEGLFGVGAARMKITLHVTIVHERVEFANDRSWIEETRLLNPSDAYMRWLRDLAEDGYGIK